MEEESKEKKKAERRAREKEAAYQERLRFDCFSKSFTESE